MEESWELDFHSNHGLDIHSNHGHPQRQACDVLNESAGFFIMSKKTEIFDTFV